MAGLDAIGAGLRALGTRSLTLRRPFRAVSKGKGSQLRDGHVTPSWFETAAGRPPHHEGFGLHT
jgi:hypothetical protein